MKSEWAVKLFGCDWKTLEQKVEEMQGVMRQLPGIRDLGRFEVRGRPNLNLMVGRAAGDRFGINVSDIQYAVGGAQWGKAVTQVMAGEQRFDFTVLYQPHFRERAEDLGNSRMLVCRGALARTLAKTIIPGQLPPSLRRNHFVFWAITAPSRLAAGNRSPGAACPR